MVDGKLHHYSAGGLYNGLVLLIDDATRPTQLFSRWYGFSLTYPKCEVHGQAGSASSLR